MSLKGTKAHTRYYLPDGTEVPGTTTIVQLLAKPQLIIWANRLGLQGIDSTKFRDKAADIGTCAHAMVQNYLAKTEFIDISLYSRDTIDLAENALLKFFEWEKQIGGIKPIELEKPLVSNMHKYGGTIDCYAEIKGQKWLIDFKTGNAIYDEMGIQLSAYWRLLREHDQEVSGVRILRIGRDESEGFEDRVFDFNFLSSQFDIFKHLLGIYYIKKSLKPTPKRRKAV